MNERQLEVQKANLAEERRLLKQLKACYEKAAKDCAEKIAALSGRTDLEHIQTIVYQAQYQQAIQKQLNSILDMLQTESFTDIATYLEQSYENGYVGAMYDLQGQGIPLILPINQDEVVYALQNNPKLSKSYYARLGEDVDFLKKAVKAQVSRGIANGSTWAQVANELSQKMTSPFGTAMYNAMRIARTEGHRIQQQSQWDALNKAKKNGCDVVKQWDSTLDGRTRTTHRMLDGQIRELDEYFEVDGKKARFPGDFGRPEEDIHCRCCVAQRARWALDQDELEELKRRAEYFGLDKSSDFEDYKRKFNIAAKVVQSEIDLASCSTVEQVEALLKKQNWFNVQTLNGKVYDTNQTLSLNGCDVDTAKGIYTACETLFTKFPMLKGKLNSISGKTLSGFTYAQCHIGLGHGGVEFNTTYFKDIAKVEKSFAGDLKAGFHPAGTTWQGIIIHEFGHAVDDYLTNTEHIAGTQKNGWKPKWVSAAMRPVVMRSCGLKIADIKSAVSGYATKDHWEWFAECFAEYVESEDPRPVAAEFGKQLEEYLKGVK